MAVDLRTRLGDVELPNPILTASGCAGAGRELAQFFDVAKIGAIVTKSVMVAPRAGRPTPRMAETPSGMLNSIGLQGPGIDAFLQRDLPWLLSRGARAVVSIAGGSVDEYAELAARLSDAAGVTAIEVNISCPNVEDRGQVFACDPGASATVIEAVRARVRYDVPVFAKLSPDVTDIVTIARACVGAGADGLSMINTLLGMVIDTDTMRPVLAGVTGGLSGPAIRPVAVRCIWQVRKALPDVPIIGMGGVRTGRDALELILAGASMVSVGTTIFHDPSACVRILRELDEELGQRGIERLGDVIGLAHEPRGAPPAGCPGPSCEPPGACAPLRIRTRGGKLSQPAPIAVALDAPDLETAARWAGLVTPHVSTVKIGLELYLRYGPGVVASIRGASGVRVFLDLKLHDIPATVAGAARAVARLRPDIVTVHASAGPEVIRAAVQAAPDTIIAAVTVLTSLSSGDLDAIGLRGPVPDAVRRLAVLAVEAGARALVCSPREVAAVRSEVGPDIKLITPGVRPPGADRNDQARVATPEEALREGADLLVIGRPITGAPDPGAAAAAIAAPLRRLARPTEGAAGRPQAGLPPVQMIMESAF